jgi:hypothetical protein
MATIKVVSALGSANETVFNIVDSAGDPVNLTTLDATVVTVEVCDSRGIDPVVSIDSDSANVSFLSDTVTVRFGALALTLTTASYFPKISYITASEPEDEVIAGEGFETVIDLKVIC